MGFETRARVTAGAAAMLAFAAGAAVDVLELSGVVRTGVLAASGFVVGILIATIRAR